MFISIPKTQISKLRQDSLRLGNTEKDLGNFQRISKHCVLDANPERTIGPKSSIAKFSCISCQLIMVLASVFLGEKRR